MKKKYLLLASGLVILGFFVLKWDLLGLLLLGKVRPGGEELLLSKTVPNVQSPECKVKNIEKIGEGAFPKWSTTKNLIAFNKEINGVYQIFTMKPDGSNLICLTCGKPQLPALGHKGQPYWHPSGEYIIFTAENTEFARKGKGLTSEPDVGLNHNIWIMTSDGSKFWQITDYPEKWGVIRPSFSHDGEKIYWNEEYSCERKTCKHPDSKWGCCGCWGWDTYFHRPGEELGLWKIKIGDVSFTSEGPVISNLYAVNFNEIYPNMRVLEGQGFTHDDKHLILSLGDLTETGGRMFWGDNYVSDLEGKSLTRLTHTPYFHNENAEYAPDGEKIVWSYATGGTPGKRVDLFLMDADGSNKVRLTHLSDPENPNYLDGTHSCKEIDWSPDGQKIIFSLGTKQPKYDNLYILTFAGACGKL